MSANAYRDTSVRTASPVQLVVQLYDGALRFVRQAQQHHGDDEPLERGRAISRALAIVHELAGSLDFEQGGEVARNLDSLYRFAADQLFEANQSRRVEPLDAVIATLAPLREAWMAIAAGDVDGAGAEADSGAA